MRANALTQDEIRAAIKRGFERVRKTREMGPVECALHAIEVSSEAGVLYGLAMLDADKSGMVDALEVARQAGIASGYTSQGARAAAPDPMP